ncbi:MAG: FUSC family protein, partial [Mycobacterium sp.]|nr:FUSC family protein [Mycobacterium sp.]
MSGRDGATPLAGLYVRGWNWAIGSDPGLLRLRMACRTTIALAAALLILFLLTRATGQPLTVALLGVLITMTTARSVNEPDARRQKITIALLPLPAAAAITAAALLAPHRVVADVAFVLVVFIAVYLRRFGPRGTALGMVTFMSYFFTLYLRARVTELPWLIGAVLVGTMCTFVMTAFVLPDKPTSVLRSTIRALRARMAIVVDTTAELVRAGQPDERRLRRLRIRTRRLNETALLVQGQIEDRVNPDAVWPGVSGEDLALWLFDAELTVERLATAGARAAAAHLPAATRAELAAAVAQLGRAIRTPRPEGLRLAAETAERLLHTPSPTDAGPAVRQLALALIDTTKAAADVRAQLAQVTSGVAAPAPEEVDEAQVQPRLRPTTRQAIQVAI